MKLKAGIIGGGKIAKVHARLFVELGISIVAVMSSSKKSSIEFSLKIEELFGLSPIPFHEIDDFLNLNMDLISICSPPKFHYDQILNSFNYSIPVFCEKPLLDISSLNNDKLKRQLENIKTHKNRFLFLNTSNTVFIDSLLNSYEFKLNFDKIKFEFYTTGLHNYKAIGLDLLPHGFSILVHVLKEQVIKNFNFKISKNKFECNFLSIRWILVRRLNLLSRNPASVALLSGNSSKLALSKLAVPGLGISPAMRAVSSAISAASRTDRFCMVAWEAWCAP